MSRRIFTTFLLATALGCATMHAHTQRLVVWHKDGQKTYFDLAEHPKTTFSGTDIIITTSSLTINYPLGQVLRYTFEHQTSAIENVNQTSPARISQNGNGLVFENLKANTHIQVFSADGKQLVSQTADGSRAVTISLANYPAGVYIVKACDVTCKILKK